MMLPIPHHNDEHRIEFECTVRLSAAKAATLKEALLWLHEPSAVRWDRLWSNPDATFLEVFDDVGEGADTEADDIAQAAMAVARGALADVRDKDQMDPMGTNSFEVMEREVYVHGLGPRPAHAFQIGSFEGGAHISEAVNVLSSLQSHFDLPGVGFVWNSTTGAGAVYCAPGRAPEYSESPEDWLTKRLDGAEPEATRDGAGGPAP